jgi:hypothetical protein
MLQINTALGIENPHYVVRNVGDGEAKMRHCPHSNSWLNRNERELSSRCAAWLQQTLSNTKTATRRVISPLDHQVILT